MLRQNSLTISRIVGICSPPSSTTAMAMVGGAIGVEPQRLAWAPSDNRSETWLAFLHDGNIWLVNPFTGIYNQITIDRTIDKIIWE